MFAIIIILGCVTWDCMADLSNIGSFMWFHGAQCNIINSKSTERESEKWKHNLPNEVKKEEFPKRQKESNNICVQYTVILISSEIVLSF